MEDKKKNTTDQSMEYFTDEFMKYLEKSMMENATVGNEIMENAMKELTMEQNNAKKIVKENSTDNPIIELSDRKFEVQGNLVENLILKACDHYRRYNLTMTNDESFACMELEQGNIIIGTLRYLLDVKIEILSLENSVIDKIIVDGEEFLV